MSDHDKKPAEQQEPEEKLWAYMAEFDHADSVIHAAEKMRDAGYTKWDVHTPFPVHGLDKAMGIKPTILPWLVLVAGLTGTTVGLLLQYWTNAVEYPYSISGKPLWGIPAAIPVAFELTILFAALTAVFGSLALNGLPRHYFAGWRTKRFDRATADRFCIVVEATDPKFSEAKSMLAGLGGMGEIEPMMEVSGGDKLPKFFMWTGIAVVLISWIPFAVILKKRHSTTEDPRIHVVPNMDWQEKFKPQQASTLFDDGRAMRLPVDGTVSRGGLAIANGDPMITGKNADGTPVKLMPMKATPELMKRGESQYNIYCIACHGQLGASDGLVHKRALERQESAWIQPTQIYDDTVLNKEDGHFFDVISNGIRNMKGYKSSISVEDRWAIVLWVRALQRRARSTKATLPQNLHPKGN